MSEQRTRTADKLRTATAAAAIGGVLLSMSGCSAESIDTRDPLQDANTIALRYSCDLLNVEDRGISDVVTASGLPRSDVRVSVVLQNVPEAQAVLDVYKNDDTVMWDSPTISGELHSTESDVAQGQVLYDRPLDSSEGVTQQIEFNPLATYPEGTSIDIVLHNYASYRGEQDATNLTGVVPCGTMMFENGQWSMSEPSGAEPYVSVETVPYQ